MGIITVLRYMMTTPITPTLSLYSCDKSSSENWLNREDVTIVIIQRIPSKITS